MVLTPLGIVIRRSNMGMISTVGPDMSRVCVGTRASDLPSELIR